MSEQQFPIEPRPPEDDPPEQVHVPKLSYPYHPKELDTMGPVPVHPNCSCMLPYEQSIFSAIKDRIPLRRLSFMETLILLGKGVHPASLTAWGNPRCLDMVLEQYQKSP